MSEMTFQISLKIGDVEVFLLETVKISSFSVQVINWNAFSVLKG